MCMVPKPAKEEKKEEKSAFTFGATSSAFTFGAPAKTEDKKEEKKTEGFSFAAPAKTEEKKEETVPATQGFTFNAAAAAPAPLAANGGRNKRNIFLFSQNCSRLL